MHQCTGHSDSNHRQCIKTAIAQAERICTEKNLRFTAIRQQVLELVWANHQPSKAYDILKLLGDNAAQPPTVYRALDFLLEHGMVHRLHSLNAYIGCEHPQQHRECYFLICTDCGNTEECCDPELKQTIRNTANNSAFMAHQTSLEIAGQCQQCRA